ncbi:protein CTLA-2-alpha-like [Microtus oregoni]|uniref:protein CTLA-2-alpha-like n=1 Tax=Microtus oregoni TaxID=111838 RepID=UPI001BB201C7|nr:protein CTLA-2-alpha-like [Microtus oregoni]
MALASSPANPSLDAEWQEWKRKYEKTYSQDEEGHRRMVWEENKKKIEEHNTEYEQGKSSFCMGLNELSDLLTEAIGRNQRRKRCWIHFCTACKRDLSTPSAFGST